MTEMNEQDYWDDIRDTLDEMLQDEDDEVRLYFLENCQQFMENLRQQLIDLHDMLTEIRQSVSEHRKEIGYGD